MGSKIKFRNSRLKYILMYFIIIVLFFFSFLIKDNNFLKISTMSLGLILLIISEILTSSNSLTLDENNVVNRKGIFSKKRIIIHYSDISDVTVDQSFIERILGIGEVHINTAGSEVKEVLIKGYSRVNLIHDLIIKKINEHKHKR